MQCFENCMPLPFEHIKSKNNMNLTKVHSWLTEMNCFFFSGRYAFLETNRCLKKFVFISRGLLCRLLLSKVDFEYGYSQLSANRHSRKRTALLTDAFSNPRFTSQTHSVFAHSHKRTLSRKRTRTLLKMKIGFFLCLRSRKRTAHVQ